LIFHSNTRHCKSPEVQIDIVNCIASLPSSPSPINNSTTKPHPSSIRSGRPSPLIRSGRPSPLIHSLIPPSSPRLKLHNPFCPLLIQHSVPALHAPYRIVAPQVHARVAVAAHVRDWRAGEVGYRGRGVCGGVASSGVGLGLGLGLLGHFGGGGYGCSCGGGGGDGVGRTEF